MNEVNEVNELLHSYNKTLMAKELFLMDVNEVNEVNELLHSYNKTLMAKELFLMDEQRK